MPKRLILGRGATKRIVKRGTPIKRDGRQTIKKAERANRPAETGSRLGVGTVEALGADLNWYLVRSQLQDATNGVTNGGLVDVFDWIGSNTTNGMTLLVGQSVVFEWSPTWNRYIVIAAEPLI